MLAATIIRSLFKRGILISLDAGGLKVSPASLLTDDDRVRIKAYRSEIIWRLRHPKGDPGAEEYRSSRHRLSLAELAAIGREIIEAQGLKPTTPNINRDLWAASIAIARLEEKHATAS